MSKKRTLISMILASIVTLVGTVFLAGIIMLWSLKASTHVVETLRARNIEMREGGVPFLSGELVYPIDLRLEDPLQFSENLEIIRHSRTIENLGLAQDWWARKVKLRGCD